MTDAQWKKKKKYKISAENYDCCYIAGIFFTNSASSHCSRSHDI